MHIPTKSSALYSLRILQTLLAIAFLVLISWCGVHRAWWDNINGTLAVGVIASILTLALSAFSIISHHRPSTTPFSPSTTKVVLLHVCVETVLLLIYIAAAGLMLRPKTGCEKDPNFPGECFAPVAGIYEVEVKAVGDYGAQPVVEWDVAVVVGFVLIVSYLVSLVLVFMERRGGKGVGSSYA